MNIDEVRKDIGLAKGYWNQLHPGQTPEQFAPLVCLLASRGEPLAWHAEVLLAEIDRLRAALAPFADAISTLGDSRTVDGEPITDETPLIDYLRVWCGRHAGPTIGDCRRAAEALGEVPS